MLLALILNGICPFGLRILAGMGLGQRYTGIYLFYWYLAGAVSGLILVGKNWRTPSWGAVLLGIFMGLASVGGQLFMGLAMANGAPGNIVYMLGMGASICIVAAGGILIFQERVGNYGKAGIIVGLFASVMLAMGG